jgi:hypothetical protein
MQTLAFGDEGQLVTQTDRPSRTLTNQVKMGIPQLFVLLWINRNTSQEAGVFFPSPSPPGDCRSSLS